MAEEKKPRRERLISPKGISVYPRLVTPDTKFNADGVYSTRLRMPIERGQVLMDKLDAMAQESFDKAVADNGGKTFKIVKGKKTDIEKNPPYVVVLDDDGNPTGEVEFNFKMKAQFKDKQGNTQKLKPVLVDARGNTIKKAISVYGGSEMKVEFTPVQYSSNLGCGVTCYLSAVQILKLVSGGGGHRFGADDDGDYEFEDEGDSGTGFSADDSGAAGEDDDNDF
jgi:hypothetical protein